MTSEHHEHPAQPQQPEDGFEEGQADREAFPEDERVGRFSEGQEELPEDDPEKHRLGRFSEGQEDLPEDDPEKLEEGRFSEGQEQLPHPDEEPPRAIGARRPPSRRRRAPTGRDVASGHDAARALAVQPAGGRGQRVGRAASQASGRRLLPPHASGQLVRPVALRIGLRELLVELAVHDAPFGMWWTVSRPPGSRDGGVCHARPRATCPRPKRSQERWVADPLRVMRTPSGALMSK
ncbi:MAG: hypothetical protein QOG35_93 [Solirubrobacteraceae bacterium]|nr:hypothetical protein [Solirubrobacteraceae bacterium]